MALTSGWFCDRAPGSGKPVYSSGTTVVNTNGPIGEGDAFDGLDLTLADPADVIPASVTEGGTSTATSASGLTRAQIFAVFEQACGFDGSTMLKWLATSAVS